jgi:hypothetical protein
VTRQFPTSTRKCRLSRLRRPWPGCRPANDD